MLVTVSISGNVSVSVSMNVSLIFSMSVSGRVSPWKLGVNQYQCDFIYLLVYHCECKSVSVSGSECHRV